MNSIVLLKLVAAVVLLLILVIKKIEPHIAMFAASIFLMIICGQGISGFAALFGKFFTNKTVYTMALTIISISMLSNVMNKTGMMNLMMESLDEAVNDPKFTLMFAPFIIGLLPVTGGAYMSCPLVDAAGKDLDISPSRLAAINLVYRHGFHFAYPMATTFYMTVGLIGCTNGELIKITFPIALFVLVAGYFCFVRPIKLPERSMERKGGKGGGLFTFFKMVSPILVALILAVLVSLPMPAAVLAGTAVALLVANGDPRTKPKEDLITLVFGGIKAKTVLVVIAALFFKEVINHISEIGVALTGLADSGMPPELIVILVCVLTALPTGSNSTGVAIANPIAVSFATTPGQVLMYAAMTMAFSFMGYYFSPVHMCQLLTLEYFKSDFAELMKEYRIFMPALVLFVAAWYLVMKLFIFV